MEKKKNFIYFILSIVFIVSTIFITYNCSDKKHVYTIAVSQCSDDAWRTKLNDEIKMMDYINDSINVIIKSANNNSNTQIEQIDSFIKMGVDLLIISPNQVNVVDPAVIKAYNSGIPVILYDRKIKSDKYSAFIGSNNYKMGYDLGTYIANELHGKGNVAEVMGLKDSSPAIERHKGFKAAMNKFPDVNIVTEEFGNWELTSGQQAMDRILTKTKDIDYVFAHNDRMAYGAYLAAKKLYPNNKIKFTGIDGLSGKGQGIELVCDGILDASYMNPTSGDEVIKLAMKILKGEKYDKNNNLATTIITKANAELTLMAAKNAARQRGILEDLHKQVSKYESHYETQTLFLWLLGIFLLSVIIASMFLYKNYHAKNILSMQLKSKNDELERLNGEVISLTQSRIEFFTNVSHELRTPLTLIIDPLERIIADKNISKPTMALLKTLQRSAFTMKRLVDDIMDFRKIQSGNMKLKPSTFKIKEELSKWIDAFYPSAEAKKVSLVLNMDEFKHDTITADEDKINRIVFNFVSNAIKYTDEGTIITVSLKDAPNDCIQLIVSDTGKGLSEEEQKKVFDRFYQANNSNGGTGIGLAIVKAYAELHNGNAFVKSQKGKGADFGIIIPRTQKDMTDETTDKKQNEFHLIDKEPKLPAKNESNSYATQRIINDNGKPTLLIIDDNNDIREYIKEIFNDGYTVFEAADGKEGLDIALKIVPDIVICDVMMPVMNGIEFCTELKSKTAICHIPVILLTAKSLNEQKIEGYEHGADSYITKPFSSKILKARVENLLNSRRKLENVFKENNVGNEADKDSKPDNMDKDFISILKTTIQKNIGNIEYNVEDLSNDMGLSRVQLYRKVKAITGVSVVDLMRKARLQRGMQLLADSDKSISEIAYEVGFSSPSYFTKCFKDEYNKLPGDIRNKQ